MTLPPGVPLGGRGWSGSLATGGGRSRPSTRGGARAGTAHAAGSARGSGTGAARVTCAAGAGDACSRGRAPVIVSRPAAVPAPAAAARTRRAGTARPGTGPDVPRSVPADEQALQALQLAPARVRRFEPMRSIVPGRSLLVCALVAAVLIAAFVFLPQCFGGRAMSYVARQRRARCPRPGRCARERSARGRRACQRPRPARPRAPPPGACAERCGAAAWRATRRPATAPVFARR